MPRNVQTAPIRDFTAGLNLRRDAALLQDGESPDLLNVDVDPRGGFSQRKGVSYFAQALMGAKSLFTWHSDSASQVIAQTGDDKLVFSSGGEFAALSNYGGHARGVTFKDRLHVVNGVDPTLRWSGSSATFLGTAWNDNLEAPTAFPAKGNMPIAAQICSHMSAVFVADTTEGGTRHPNRIRWSHPNFPEDWRSFDFIDIDPGSDGDNITALVPYGDRLLIFKKKSIYALYGHDPSSFQVFPVTREVGCPHAGAVVSTDIGIYFWSWPDGLFFYDGKSPQWQFERLYPAIQDGTITNQPTSKVMLGWGGRRLWVSITYDGSPVRNRTFVLDPTLGKTGSWVAYDLGLGPFTEFAPPGQEALLLAAANDKRVVVKLDQLISYDEFLPNMQTPIESYYRTKFWDMGNPAIPKRWKRPEVVMQSGSEAPVFVTAFRDWDSTRQTRAFVLNPQGDDVPPEGSSKWDAAFWDNFDWGGDSRGANPVSSAKNELHRGSPLGNARAVALLFQGPANLSPWGVNSITLKYIAKRPRS